MPEPNDKMDELTILNLKRDKVMADERYAKLSDDRKKEVLGMLFDEHGTSVLKKDGIQDESTKKALRDKWVDYTFSGSGTLKKKEESQVGSDASNSGKVETIVPPEQVADTIPETPKQDTSIPDFREGLVQDTVASQSTTRVDAAKNPEIEKDIVKEGSVKTIDELQSDLQDVNTKIQQFGKEESQKYKSPFLALKEDALELQYQSSIQSGIPEQDAVMNRDIEKAKIYAENQEDYADMLLKTEEANPALKPTIDLANKANELNKIYNDIKTNNGWENLGEGVKEGVKGYFKDYEDFLGGFSTNKAITQLSDKIQKINDGENLKFNEDEKLLLQTLITTSDLTGKINKELPTGYNIGQGIGGSLGFMAEFAITYGLGSGITAAAEYTKGIASIAAKGAAKKAIQMSANVAATLATSGVQTAAMPTLYKEIAKNSSNGQDFGNSVFNAYYDTYTEALSERLFTGTIGGSSNGFQKFINRTGVKTAGTPINVLKASGEEYLEEKFSEAMKGAKDAKSFEQFATDFFDAKQNLTTLATTALMAGTMSVPAMGGIAMDKYGELKFNNKFKAVSTALPPEIKTGIDEILSNQDLTIEKANELVGDLIKANVTSGNIDEEQGKEVVVNAQQYFLLSLQKQAQEGKLVDKEAPPSYTIGDKVFETKEELLSEVEKLKGQENTPEIQVENDEETANKVNEMLGEKEAKKADIESRRQEEIIKATYFDDMSKGEQKKFLKDPEGYFNEHISRINKILSKDPNADYTASHYENILKEIKEINSKYDAELAALEVNPESPKEAKPADQVPDAGNMVEKPQDQKPVEEKPLARINKIEGAKDNFNNDTKTLIGQLNEYPNQLVSWTETDGSKVSGITEGGSSKIENLGKGVEFEFYNPSTKESRKYFIQGDANKMIPFVENYIKGVEKPQEIKPEVNNEPIKEAPKEEVKKEDVVQNNIRNLEQEKFDKIKASNVEPKIKFTSGNELARIEAKEGKEDLFEKQEKIREEFDALSALIKCLEGL